MNSTAHLVARALRDRRIVTWSYFNSGTGYWRFHNKTRSQILRDVRRTPENLFNYGLEHDPSRQPSTNGRHGLQAYRIEPQPAPAPAPAPRDNATELAALYLKRIARDFDALSETDKRYILLQLSERLTLKTR